jgi:hypothetical protein
VLPLSRHRRVTFASSVAGRRCRRRDLSACRLHALLLAGAAAFEASTHAVYIQCFWQELPPTRPRRVTLAGIVAVRSRRFRGIYACRLHPVMLADAAAGEASAHAVGIHCCWPELPSARPQCMPHEGTVVGRCCRRHGTSACPLHPLELPPARPQHMPLACMVAGSSCRRRGTSACRLHPVLLAGAAAGMAPAHAACVHRCWQGRLPARS